jgi:hypothetical protein
MGSEWGEDRNAQINLLVSEVLVYKTRVRQFLWAFQLTEAANQIN